MRIKGSIGGEICGDVSGEGLRDRIEIGVEMIGLEEPVFAVDAAVQRNPNHGAFGQGEFLGGVAREAEARDHGMLQAGAERSSRLVKIAAGKVPFKRSSTDGNAVKLNCGAGRRAGDLQLVRDGGRRAGKQKQGSAENKFRAGSHEKTSPEG